MVTVVVATVVVGVFAAFIYLAREQLGLVGLGLAALRTAAVCSLLLLLLNPGKTGREPGGPPTVLLDASLSMGTSGGAWDTAVDTTLALAGEQGTLLAFGASVEASESDRPEHGASRLAPALRTAVAMGGPVVVVTDGELDDAGTIPPSLLENVSVVTLPRDTLPNVALLDVQMPPRIQADDTVRIGLMLGVWGDGFEPNVRLDVSIRDRRLLSHEYHLGPAPSVARRALALPPGLLDDGDNLLRFSVAAAGDVEPSDDERIRLIEVSEQPEIVVLMDPPDWEGRFLAGELSDVSRTTVRGFARISSDRWLDTRTAHPVSGEAVTAFARDAGLLVVRSREDAPTGARRGVAVWDWPTYAGAVRNSARDWYVNGATGASPLTGRLGGIQWDSVPPIHGLEADVGDVGDWVAAISRQGRRGAERPVLLGSDSLGVRSLTTFGTGWWRWKLRGGAAREAYRAILAAGVDWLLQPARGRNESPLRASNVVALAEPVRFWWSADSIPSHTNVVISKEGTDTTSTHALNFDALGVAHMTLSPGVYSWLVPGVEGVSGTTVVEEYSDEYHPRPVVFISGGELAGLTLFERHARDNWWLYLIVVVALTMEWAWRNQRGLP